MTGKNTFNAASFSVRHQIIEYQAFCSAMERIGHLHQRSKQTGQPGGLLITGLSGTGKSTVKSEYQSRFPIIDTGDAPCIPVLTVDTPAGPTVKNLAEAILAELGDTMRHSGTTEQKTQRIYRFLKLCKVELILIDEFQHFIQHGRKSQILLVTDWLKNLINTAGIPVVLLGLPECEFVLRLNVQLARRFSARYYLKPFDFDTEEEKRDFRTLLAAIEQTLPLPSTSLSNMEMAHRFNVATYGLIDFVCKITDAAVQIALRQGCRLIDRHIYAEAFEEEVWRDAPHKLNPFSSKKVLRSLTQPGEPFSEWAAVRSESISAARKKGMG